MPPKPDAGKPQQECWECLRRYLACDGRRPVCECCRSAGIVCPGYEDRRPLTWVTPGNITVTRVRRAKTTSAAALTPAAFKKRRCRERPRLPSPASEEGVPKTSPGATTAASSRDDGKATEDDDDPDVASSGDQNDDGGTVEDNEEGGVDDGEGTISSEKQQSTALAATTPQTPTTSHALVPHRSKDIIPTIRQSVNCIPISLQQDEFELMEAVEYCVSIQYKEKSSKEARN